VKKKRAEELSASWGGKPCDHPALAKEYDQGVLTGRYVCTQCGQGFTYREKAELAARRSG
jgi:transposase-like protein